MLSNLMHSSEHTPAPYGRACTSCARAKHRCINRAGGASCERCHRLEKACQPSTSSRTRSVRKQPNSKTAELQKKVDELVSLLRSQTGNKQLDDAIPPTSLRDSASVVDNFKSNIESATTSPSNVPRDTVGNFPRGVSPTAASAAPPYHGGMSPSSMDGGISIYGISDTTANEQLNTFRRAFLPIFPFTYIPITLSASDLCQEKPFLHLVIMSLTTQSGAQQLAMGDSIRRIVALKAVAEHEINLDILLGILCYIGWSQYHKKEYKPYLIVWIQVALGLVYELGIHKPRTGDLGKDGYIGSLFPPRSTADRLRTMEERRAILAMFMISSQVWAAMRKMAPLRWTPYMDDCVRVLVEGCETELDVVLATQARCHVVVNEMTHSVAEWATERGESALSIPPSYFVKAMHKQLSDIRESLTAEMQSNTVIQLYLYSTEALVKESLLYRQKAQTPIGLPDLKRLEELDSILTLIERWLEVLFDLSGPDWVGISFGIFNQFGHCAILLFKLTTLEDPGWDTEAVKKRANVFDVLERAAQRAESTPGLLGMIDNVHTGESAFLFRSAQIVRGMKGYLQAQMTSNTLQKEVRIDGHPHGFKVTGESFISDDVDVSFMDDQWVTDSFIPFWQF